MKEVLKQGFGGGGGASGTAAAGAGADDDLKVAAGAGQVLSRSVPPQVVSHFISKIAGLEGQLATAMREERMQAKLEAAKLEAEQAENLLLYEEEIHSR